jgi:Ca2+-binding EF-hand superfamily protein
MIKTPKLMRAFVCGILIGPALTIAAPGHAQSQDQMRQLLERADTNGDGDITRAEFDQVRSEMFARLDRNGDGNVDSKDRPRMFGERFDQAYRMLVSLDTDGNRRISRAELANGEAPAFVAGDTNGDNVLSRTEIAALRPSR